MLRIFTVIVVVLSVGGCANVQKVLAVATTTIDQPVSPKMVYQAEEGLKVAMSGLVAYRRLCITKRIDQSCRSTITSIQMYTIPAKQVIVELRTYVRKNDRVNAISAFKTLQSLILSIQSAKAIAGVTI